METPKRLTIAIVATGPSVKNQEIKGDIVIAVNSAISICKPDIWFSLDPSPANRKIIDSSTAGEHCDYFVAFPSEFLTPPHVTRLRRVSSPKQRERKPWQTDELYYLFRWGCRLNLAEDTSCIHTGNSAFGALGLAYHLRHHYPDHEITIILYGVDGTDEDRVTGGKPNRLDHLPLLFESAIPQLKASRITVLNASQNSRITCFYHYLPRTKS